MNEPTAVSTMCKKVGAHENAAMSEVSLESLYDGYGRSLYRFALTLVGSTDDAEDAVSEVFARVARDPDRLGRVGDIRAYLFSSTRNAAYSILRARRRRENIETTLCGEIIVAAQGSGHMHDSEAVCRAFAGLPVEQREVVVLKVYDQMTFREIAEATRTRMNTVVSRYRYGIEKLRQALEVNEDG